MKKTFFSLMAALLLLSSCEVHHFMTDASYRATVEADLNEGSAGASARLLCGR